MVFGTDVSFFQARVDWKQLRIDGNRFFYARCTEGVVPDKTHDIHLVNGRGEDQAGGSYGVGHPSQKVDDLVDAFLARASLVKGQLRPVLDIETLATGPDGRKHIPDNAGAWSDAWCERVKSYLVSKFPESFGARRGPIIYASASYFLTMCAQRPSVGGPFGWDWWCADYTGLPNKPTHLGGVELPPYVAHQFAGNVTMKGQVGLWDRDVIYDGEDGLDRLRL